MKDEPLKLTRRKVLGGLTTIGVAGAGAGLGTSALYSDTESFTGNSMTAGTLNLALHAGVVATNRTDAAAPTIAPGAVEVDGEASVLFTFEDVKPGDCYVIHTDEIIEGNPAYLQMSFEEAAGTDLENGYTEPEPTTSGDGDVDDPGDPTGGGELDDLMEVTSWYGGYSGNENLVDLATVTCDNLSETALAQLIKTQTLESAFDGLAEKPDTGEDVTLDANYEAVAPHQTNINDEFIPGQGSGPPFEPNDLNPGTYRKFWEFSLPESVGNEVQGDSVAFSITAMVEQVRHNDSPFQ